MARSTARSAFSSGKPAPRAQARTGEGKAGDRPVEGHTDADRQALDRLLGEHLDDAPRR